MKVQLSKCFQMWGRLSTECNDADTSTKIDELGSCACKFLVLHNEQNHVAVQLVAVSSAVLDVYFAGVQFHS